MLVRALLLAVCAVAIVLLASTGRSYRACSAARLDLYHVVLHGASPSLEEPALATMSRRCRGSDGMVAAAGALVSQGRDAEAASFALGATEREPQSATAWNALAIAARTVNPALARRAAARALALSPLDRPPAPKAKATAKPATTTKAAPSRAGSSASP